MATVKYEYRTETFFDPNLITGEEYMADVTPLCHFYFDPATPLNIAIKDTNEFVVE